MNLGDRYGAMMKRIASLYSDHPDVCAQIASSIVVNEDWDGNRSGGHLRFKVPSSAPPVDPVAFSTIDAFAADEDGTPIEILLHVVGAYIDWGEWFRVDGEPITHWPPTSVSRTQFE